MLVKFIDLCCSKVKVNSVEEEELFGYEFGSWKCYINCVNRDNLDGLKFNIKDIDREVFILDDGGELFRLNNGNYVNVCWRGDCCRVWYEDDEERIEYFNKKLKK